MRLAILWQRILPPVWLGTICAVAMEAQLKFQAPGITRELGLGIGKLIFTWLNRLECVFAVVLAIVFFAFSATKNVRLILAVILAILTVQTFWLLPNLIARIDLIVSGQTPADSSVHIFYIVLEICKIISLAGLSVLLNWPATAPPK